MSDSIKTPCSFATKAMHQPMPRFDHLYRIIGQQAWLGAALKGVLANKGARTPGLDGVTKEDLTSESTNRALVQEIEQELRERSFRPSPVRRVPIPKSHGTYRPLGIATFKDRVGQRLLKRGLEPLWESDCLNGSHGLRPGRSTMDCLALLDSYINERNKYFWVIEGDIRAAFDSMHQATLLTLLATRVAASRLLGRIDGFLKAGLMQGTLLHRTDIGPPQGAIGTLPTKWPTLW